MGTIIIEHLEAVATSLRTIALAVVAIAMVTAIRFIIELLRKK